MKKLFKFFLYFLLAVLIAMVILPFAFKDKVVAEVKAAINDQVNAKVDFGSAGLSLFKSFPNATISLSDLDIKGVGIYEDIDLFKSKEIDLSVNLSSLFGNNIEINKIVLDQPIINLIVDKNGKANYDITKENSSSDSGSDITGKLKAYIIKNGSIRYRDRASDLDLSLSTVNHSGKGDFSSTVFDLVTTSNIKDTDVSMGNIAYLKDANISGDVDIKVDLNTNTFTLNKNNIRINNLDLDSKGYLKLLESGYQMDLDFKAPNNDFKDLFSLIPYAYGKDFENITARGNSNITGKIKGVYTDSGKYPAIDIKVSAKDGYVKYPNFNDEIKNINFDLSVDAAKSDWSDLSVLIPQFSILLGKEKFEGKLDLKNAMGNFLLDAFMKGNIDLELIKRLFPVEGVDILSGLAKLDIKIKSDKRSIELADYNNIAFEGNSEFSNVKIKYDEYPLLSIPSGAFNASPSLSNFTVDNAKFGNSDFDAKGKIKNPLSLTSSDLKTEAEFDFKSKVLDYNQLMSFSESEEPEVNNAMQIDSFSESIITNSEIVYTANIDQLKYEDYDINNLRAEGLLSADNITIRNGELMYDKSKINIEGDIKNSYNYIFHNQDVNGNINIKSKSIDLNSMYSEEENADAEDLETVILPDNMDFTIYTDIGEVKYGNYLLEDIEGAIEIKDAKADFKNVAMNLFGGALNLNGFYDSKDETRPEFAIDYKLDNVPIKDLYAKSNSFKSLAPIAEYLTGKINTTLSMSGPLGKDMMPLLGEITAKGFLETLNSTIKGFKPMSAVGDKLGIAALDNISIENTKNWFTVENGFVVLEEQDRSIDEMKFSIGGKHSVDQKIDYKIRAEIPREKLKANVASNVLESGLGLLESEAGKRGVNIDLGDMIFMDIFLTGSITNPKIKIVPTGSGGKSAKDIIKDEITNQADQLKDTITKEVEKKVDAVKEQVEKKVEETTGRVRIKVNETVNTEVEKVKDKVEEQVKDKVSEEIKNKVEDKVSEEVKDKVDEVLGDKGKEVEGKAKDVLKDIFKKKKKDN